MKISELIKDLNKYKKEHGDIHICVDAKVFSESYQGEKMAYESLQTKIVKMPFMNMDTGVVSKRKYNTVVIEPEGL